MKLVLVPLLALALLSATWIAAAEFASVAPEGSQSAYRPLLPSASPAKVEIVEGRTALVQSGDAGEARDGLSVPDHAFYVATASVLVQRVGEAAGVTMTLSNAEGDLAGAPRVGPDEDVGAGSEIAPFPAGVWNSLTVFFDNEAGLYSAWVCGEVLAVDEPFVLHEVSDFVLSAGTGWRVAWSNITLVATDDEARALQQAEMAPRCNENEDAATGAQSIEFEGLSGRDPAGERIRVSVQWQSVATTVLLEEVLLPAPGYVALHDDRLQEGQVLESIVGVSNYLTHGLHRKVAVPVSLARGEHALLAIPYRESSGNHEFDFVRSGGAVDSPYLENGTSGRPYGGIKVYAQPFDVMIDDAGGPHVRNLTLPPVARQGAIVTLSGEVANPTEAGQTLELVLLINGAEHERVSLEVAADAAQSFSMSFVPSAAGPYQLSVGILGGPSSRATLLNVQASSTAANLVSPSSPTQQPAGASGETASVPTLAPWLVWLTLAGVASAAGRRSR